MATYAAPQAIPKTGLNATYNAAAATDRVPPGSLLHYKNGNGSALTVTIVTMDNADGDLVIADRAQTAIGATTGMGFILIPEVWPYVDPVDGLVAVTTSVQASVTFAILATP
jgi:hypothetical protein